jgi:hypothetical protein
MLHKVVRVDLTSRRVSDNLRCGLALALVRRDVICAAEDLESWVALNAILLAKLGLLCAVDLDEPDVLLLQ